MKNCDKYPSACEEDINNLPKPPSFWRNPFVWVALVILLIAAARTCHTVEDLGCSWEFWEWYEEEYEGDDENDHEDDDEDAPATVPADESDDDHEDDGEDD